MSDLSISLDLAHADLIWRVLCGSKRLFLVGFGEKSA